MPVKTIKIFDGVAIAKNGSVAAKIDLKTYLGSTVGKIAFQYEITEANATDVNVDYAVSLDGANYLAPAGSAAIFDAIDANSTTVRGYKEIDPEFAPWIRITATEQNVVAITNFSMWMSIG